MNGLAGCYVSTIGKPHEYFDLTGEGDPPRMDFYRGSKADEMIVLGGPKQFLWARRES